jgi:AraC-like DNA-binding protein
MDYLYKNSLSSNELITTIYKNSCDPTLNHVDYHPHFELYFCNKNLPQKLFFNGEEYFFNKPIVALTSPYTPHSILLKNDRPDSDKPLYFERRVIYFNEYVLKLFDKQFLPNELETLRSTIIFELSEQGIETLTSVYNLLMKPHTSASEKIPLLIHIINYLFRSNDVTRRTTCHKTSDTMTSILQYIRKNLAGNLDANFIAKQFFISRAKLDRDFRKYVGNSFHNVVKECRFVEAINLLQQTDLPIGEISQLCGFKNEYYFYSFFKTKANMTPTKFRNLYKYKPLD